MEYEDPNLVKYNNSTIKGDSGSPVFCWDEKSQHFVLVACHMQAGNADSQTNEGLMLAGLTEGDSRLFRP
nr:MAG: hypothetical protein H2BulkLitter1224547_000001 [Astroviridae sp.]